MKQDIIQEKIPVYFECPFYSRILLNSFIDTEDNNRELIFNFLKNHFAYEDLKTYQLIFKKDDTDLLKRVIWLIGKACSSIPETICESFLEIFQNKNHELIGILATAIGRMRIRNFDYELLQALKDFDFYSRRRRIIWTLGELGDQEFLRCLNDLHIEEDNYSLLDELQKAKDKLAKNEVIGI